jgi:hypothetical protein
VFQIAVDRGMHSHGLDPEFAAGPQDAERYFATIGDHYFVEHGGAIRK